MEPEPWELNALEIGLSKKQLDGLKSLLTDASVGVIQ